MIKLLILICSSVLFVEIIIYPEVKDGYLIIQAEQAMNANDTALHWEKDTVISGFTGTAYFHFKGDSEFPEESIPYEEEERNRVLTYQFKIDKPGVYYVKVYNYHFHEDGDNDCWISMNKGQWSKTYDHNANQWSWDETGNWNTYILEKGINTVEIAGRSHNFIIDKLVVFHEDVAPEPFDNHQDAVWSNLLN